MAVVEWVDMLTSVNLGSDVKLRQGRNLGYHFCSQLYAEEEVGTLDGRLFVDLLMRTQYLRASLSLEGKNFWPMSGI